MLTKWKEIELSGELTNERVEENHNTIQKARKMALGFADEMEEDLPRETLALIADLSPALVERIVQCAESELVRDRVVVASAKATASTPETHIAQFVPEWQGDWRDTASVVVFGAVAIASD